MANETIFLMHGNGEHSLTTRLVDQTLVISSTCPLRTVSSSLIGGGLAEKSYLVNSQVPHGYTSDDPIRDLEEKLADLQLPIEETVAMMTAADVDQAVDGFAIGDQFALKCYVTAGVGNAARAGDKRQTFPGYTAGTINIILVIDGRLTDSALVNAVTTITEAKTAALQDIGVTDRFGRLATGTTTDSVIVAATQNKTYPGIHQYAGLATELGSSMAQIVYQSLLSALGHSQVGSGQNRHGS